MKTKTVERLMNETPEHIKQQVSEYADALVNKKQSSIDWFYQRILAKDIESVFEQAKAMHKEEIQDAVNFGDKRGKITTYSTVEQYYNETFGGKDE